MRNQIKRMHNLLRTINFGGISLDLTRNLISRDILVKMRSLLTLSKFSKKRKQLFDNKYISHTESQKVSFVSYRNSISYQRDVDKMSKFYLKIKNKKQEIMEILRYLTSFI